MIDSRIMRELASAIADAGSTVVHSSEHTATVTRVDLDGTVWVTIPGGADETPASTSLVSVSQGDTVKVLIANGRATVTGNATSPAANVTELSAVEQKADTATNVAVEAGSDAQRANETAEAAMTAAEEATAAADAIGQHFWNDTVGVHVSEVERDTWNRAVLDDFDDYDPTTKPYNNLLLNSLGILLRTAIKNLVSITRSAVAFFDGNGNAASNVTASFGADGAQIGKSNDNHVIIDPDSMRLIGQSGNRLFGVNGSNDWCKMQLGVTLAEDIAYTNRECEYILEQLWSFGEVVVEDGINKIYLSDRDSGWTVQYNSDLQRDIVIDERGIPFASAEYLCIAYANSDFDTVTRSVALDETILPAVIQSGNMLIRLDEQLTVDGLVNIEGGVTTENVTVGRKAGNGTVMSYDGKLDLVARYRGQRHTATLGTDGALTNNGIVQAKSDNITSNTAPSSAATGAGYFRFLDSAGTSLGYIVPYFPTSGNQYLRFQVQRVVSGSTKAHRFNLGIDASGKAIFSVEGTGAAMAWKKGLNVCMSTAIFTGKNVSNGGTIGTYTEVFDYHLFWAQLSGSNNSWCLCYRTGSTSTAGYIRGVGALDNGTNSYVFKTNISVSTAGVLKVVASSQHLLGPSGNSGTTLYVSALYGIK